MILIQVIFWVSLFLIFYSYLLFPLILQWMARNKSITEDLFRPEAYPKLSVLISAFNEETVMEEKIRGLLESDFPSERLEILVGSDASTDRTNEILKKLEKQQAIIQERKRISSDLHDEVGSGLSRIMLLSELMKSEARTPESRKEAERLAAISHELSSNINEIVWALNSNNDYVVSVED